VERPTPRLAQRLGVTEPEGASYGVPAAQLEETFQHIIVPDYLLRSGPEPQQQPEVVLLGGQPGAGKSTTAFQLQHQFADRGGLVCVTWDDFRPFHPDYERLLAERPADMPDATRPAARWWQDRAADYLRTYRYNTLLEDGFRDPDSVLATALDFHNAGYRVHVSALAVPAALSRLGIIERFARQVETAGTGRWTTAASHDGDYLGTEEVLRLAQSSPAVSRISLWTRDGLVYDNRRDTAGAWASAETPIDVLTEARSMPLTRLQRVALANRLDTTLAQLESAGLAHPALREMATTIAENLNPEAADICEAADAAPAAEVGQAAGSGPGSPHQPELPEADLDLEP
jgi:UDP-N-acetylglucosamine kinase